MRQSVFVYDLKGENWDHSAGFRHAIGQRVLNLPQPCRMRVAATTPWPRFAGRPITEIADAQTIANAVIRHGDDESLYKHFEDAAV